MYALVAAHNARQEAAVTNQFHADITQKTSGYFASPTVASDTVTAATATDLATSLVLVNQIKAVLDRHFVDTLAHDTAVSATITIADATDLATAITLANNLKDMYTTGGHVDASNVHFNDDSTNVVTNADATDQTTLNTLVNEIKGDVNAHITSAPIGSMVQLVPA
jgi:hypothetical protein